MTMRKFLLFLIKIYQKTISPLLPARCRYYPTCSSYAKTALLNHSLFKAIFLIAKRLLSCHPLGGCGVDLVPLPLYYYHFVLSVHTFDCVYKDRYGYHVCQFRLMA